MTPSRRCEQEVHTELGVLAQVVLHGEVQRQRLGNEGPSLGVAAEHEALHSPLPERSDHGGDPRVSVWLRLGRETHHGEEETTHTMGAADGSCQNFSYYHQAKGWISGVSHASEEGRGWTGLDLFDAGTGHCVAALICSQLVHQLC